MTTMTTKRRVSLQLAVTGVMGAASLVQAQSDGLGFGWETWPAPKRVERLLVADLDADGRADVVGALKSSSSSELLAIYRQPPVGMLTGPVVLSGASVGGAVGEVQYGDLNNDGRMDLVATVTAGANAGRVVSWRGLATGGFAAPVERAVNFAPQSLSLGDVNEDGRLDAAITSATSAYMLTGDGFGGFASPIPVSLGAAPHPVLLADADGDSHLDLVAMTGGASTKRITVRSGDGAGGFSPLVQSDVSADLRLHGLIDLDADGLAEAVLWTQLSSQSPRFEVWRNAGAGQFSFGASQTLLGRAWSITLGDVDSDATLDLVACTDTTGGTGFSVAALLGPASIGSLASVESPGVTSGTLALADVTGDARPELLVAAPATAGPASAIFGPVAIVLQAGGLPKNPNAIPLTGLCSDFEIADLDRDGDVDIAASLWDTEALELKRGDGAGTFTPWQSLPVGFQPHQLEVADLDGDGLTDILVDGEQVVVNGSGTLYATRGRLRPYHGGASGSFAPLAAFQAPIFHLPLLVADFNGDQQTDLMTGWWVAPLWLGAGGGQFEAPVLASSMGAFAAHAAHDWNGDGVFDVLASDPFSGEFITWIGRGDGRFLRGPSTPDHGANAVCVTDWNADSIEDVVAVNTQDPLVYPYLNDGAGTFAPATPIFVGTGGSFVDHVDIDNDGLRDLVVTGWLSPVAAIAPRTAGGGFDAPRFIHIFPYDVRVKLADVDGAPGVELISIGGPKLLVYRR